MEEVHGRPPWMPSTDAINGWHPRATCLDAIHGGHSWGVFMDAIHGFHQRMKSMGEVHRRHPSMPFMECMYANTQYVSQRSFFQSHSVSVVQEFSCYVMLGRGCKVLRIAWSHISQLSLISVNHFSLYPVLHFGVARFNRLKP